MKKHEIYKMVQLSVFILLALVVCGMVFMNPDLYHQVANDPNMTILCGLLWAVLLCSFFFIYMDLKYFLSYKKDYSELSYAVHSDPRSGISNRFSCDMLIERYLDKPLPEDMACIMVDIANIQEVNRLYGHVQGNTVIHDFADILKMAAGDICFVGRNGGNKFLALFESGSQEDIDTFLQRLKRKMESYNADTHTIPVEYAYGVAFHEGEAVATITDLIALSNCRIPPRTNPQN